jgi:RNA polymerase sigma-70 factor, ECF subfamily
MAPIQTESGAPSAELPSTISSSLLERAKRRDQDAWRRLVHIFSPLVYQWSRRLGVQEADAADILQEVFGAVSDHVAGFRREHPNDSFRGWLWMITRNKINDLLRRKREVAEARGGTDWQDQMLQIPESLYEISYPLPDKCESHELAKRALETIRAEFEDRTWQAFLQTTVDKRPAAEVAEEFGMSVQAVYQAKSRVMRRVRKELRDLI